MSGFYGDDGLDYGSSLETLTLRVNNSTGAVLLLKEVVLLWQEGTKNPDGTIAVAGHPVLVTDGSRIPEFSGIAQRDGDPVGKRLSAVGFDFPGASLPCTGRLGTDGLVSCDLTLGAEVPTNPFLHRYHPDHNNLDETYVGSAPEVNAVQRTITLEFSAPPETPPGWGFDVIGGTYKEQVCGSAVKCINVAVAFSLDRVSEQGTVVE